jgi:predicted branched-subunit amino acid permease
MSPLWRTGGSTLPRKSQPQRGSTLLRDVALVCLADGLVGLSFGATTVAGHLSWWVPIAMSLLVFAGGSQFAAVGVVLAGGSPFAAVAAGAVLNTRLLPYGFAVADVVGRPEHAAPDRVDAGLVDAHRADPDLAAPVRTPSVRWRGLIRLLGAQVITDESTAFALRQTDPARRRAAFWTCGLTLFAVWNVSVLLGVLAGSVVRNTNAFGLDATFPAVVIALALPALADLRTRFSAGTGAVIAVALTPVLPAGLPMLAALAGLAAGWRPRRRTTAHPAPDRAMTDPTSACATTHPANARTTTQPTSTQPVAHSPSDRGEH